MDRNLALEFVRVTEAAAIAAAEWIGRGEAKKADGAAVNQMRNRFNQIEFKGTVVIGEGEKDEAPQLYKGENVGTGSGPEMDLAIDPLECTDSVAWGRYNAIAVIAAGAKGSLFSGPDTYMDKIAVGKEARGVVDLDAPPKDNIEKTAKAIGKDVSELTIVVMDRPRNEALIEEIRKTGARIRLITDGDLASAIAACIPDNEVDMLMGVGGSAEAVLASVAVKIMGGEHLARFKSPNEKHETLVKEAGFDQKRIYTVGDFVKGNQLTFTATGIIEGPLLQGVITHKGYTETHSMVLRGSSGTLRYITTHHDAYSNNI